MNPETPPEPTPVVPDTVQPEPPVAPPPTPPVDPKPVSPVPVTPEAVAPVPPEPVSPEPVAPPVEPTPAPPAPAPEAAAPVVPAPEAPAAAAPTTEPIATPVPTPAPPVAAIAPAAKTNVMAVVGLVLAFFAAPLGLILSLIALAQIKKRGEGGKGVAIAGAIIGAVGTLFLALAAGAFIFIAVSATQATAGAILVSDQYLTKVQNQDGVGAYALESPTTQTSSTADDLTTLFKTYQMGGNRTIVARNWNTANGVKTAVITYKYSSGSPKYLKVTLAETGTTWEVTDLVPSDSIDTSGTATPTPGA